MATTSISRGTPTAVTMTLASLASSGVDAGRQSDAIDCSSMTDMEIGGKVTLGTTPTAFTRVEVWLSGSYDGTSFSGGLGATDAAVTPIGSKTMLKLVAVLPVLVATSNVTYTWNVGSVAGVFGGALPSEVAVFITHSTVAALNATAGNHEVKYRAINYVST
jgi:hypothetical protein